MVSRCANPACGTRFRYLHEGRVYRISGPDRCHDDWQCEGPHIHYFWLCETCALKFTLRCSKREGIFLEPVGGGAQVAVEAPTSAEPDLRREHAVV